MLKTTTFAINLLLAGAVFAAEDSFPNSSLHSTSTSLSSVSSPILNLRDNITAEKLPDGSLKFSDGTTLSDQTKPLLTKYDMLTTLPTGNIGDLFHNKIKKATSFSVSELIVFLSGFHQSQDQSSLRYNPAATRHTLHHEEFDLHAAFIDTSEYSLKSFKDCIFCYYDPESACADGSSNGITYPLKTFESSGDMRTYAIKVLFDLDNKDKDISRGSVHITEVLKAQESPVSQPKKASISQAKESPLRGRSKSEVAGRVQLRHAKTAETTEKSAALASSKSYSSSTSSSLIVTPSSPKLGSTSPTQRKATFSGSLSPRSQEASSATAQPSSPPEKKKFGSFFRKNSSKNLKSVITSSAPSPANVGGIPSPFARANSKELKDKLAKQLNKSEKQ